MHGHECLIKGVFFFETPFRGSKIAQLIVFLARSLFLSRAINTTTLNYLAVKNKDIEKIVDEFEQIVKANEIQVAIFY